MINPNGPASCGRPPFLANAIILPGDGACCTVWRFRAAWRVPPPEPLVRAGTWGRGRAARPGRGRLPSGSARHGWLARRLADALYRTGDLAEAERVAILRAALTPPSPI